MKLERVILHDLEHGKQGKVMKNDEYVLDKQQQALGICLLGYMPSFAVFISNGWSKK